MDYITFEELRELGCPDELLMQYFNWSREEVYEMIRRSNEAK